jgi:hypothetical protein
MRNIMNYKKQIEKYANELGVDLSKWNLESDEKTDYYSDENECRELFYRSNINTFCTLYVAIEYFDPPNWEIIDFKIDTN